MSNKSYIRKNMFSQLVTLFIIMFFNLNTYANCPNISDIKFQNEVFSALDWQQALAHTPSLAAHAKRYAPINFDYGNIETLSSVKIAEGVVYCTYETEYGYKIILVKKGHVSIRSKVNWHKTNLAKEHYACDATISDCGFDIR